MVQETYYIMLTNWISWGILSDSPRMSTEDNIDTDDTIESSSNNDGINETDNSTSDSDTDDLWYSKFTIDKTQITEHSLTHVC